VLSSIRVMVKVPLAAVLPTTPAMVTFAAVVRLWFGL
jgi:hypothetical protein